jgi:hypothetical protein
MAEPEKVEADRGIYPKYVVFRHPEKDEGNAFGYWIQDEFSEVDNLELIEDFTFTLRPSKDYHARVALAAYAESVRHWNPQLAEDVENALSLAYYEPPRMEPT